MAIMIDQMMIVADQNQCTVMQTTLFRQQIQRFLLGNWIQARGHFIGKQQDRFEQQSAQNRNAL